MVKRKRSKHKKTIVIDLSKGWDKKEIDKLVDNLPVTEDVKKLMYAQNQFIDGVNKIFRPKPICDEIKEK